MKVAIVHINMNKVIGFLLIIILVLLANGESFAASKSAVLSVSTSVLPYVKYDVLHQEGSLTITSHDIERGYIEVSRATVLSVKTNSFNGYLMNFFVAENLFSNVTLREGNNMYSFSETDGEVHFPSHDRHYAEKIFTFKFDLRADTKPGTYQWPVAFMISPM